MSAPNFAKTKRGANGKFLPKPLLFHLRHPNSKTSEPKFWQILFLQKLYTFRFLNTKCSKSCESVPHFLTPKNSFAKTSSALFRHLPEYLEGRTPKKNVLSFLKEISPPPNQESKRHFSLVLPSEARQWRNDSFHIRILLEISSDFVLETQPKNRIALFAKIRSVAKRRDGVVRQNPPRVFEIQKKRAGREAGVYDEYIIQNFVLRANLEANNYQYLT